MAIFYNGIHTGKTDCCQQQCDRYFCNTLSQKKGNGEREMDNFKKNGGEIFESKYSVVSVNYVFTIVVLQSQELS